MHEIGVSRGRLQERVVTLNARAACTFVAMHGAVCLFDQERLCLVDSRTMYGYITLCIGYLEQNVGEFLSDVLGAFGWKRSSLVKCNALDKTNVSTEQRDATRVEYAEAIEAQLTEVTRALGESSKAWVDEQWKIRELAAAM